MKTKIEYNGINYQIGDKIKFLAFATKESIGELKFGIYPDGEVSEVSHLGFYVEFSHKFYGDDLDTILIEPFPYVIDGLSGKLIRQ